MLDSIQVKSAVKMLGADLCGVAPAGRFDDAPEGFRPGDIYKECRSVVVFARRIPVGPLFSSSCVPYTFVNNMMTQEVDRLTVEIALELEELGVGCVPIPSDDPYEHWEPERLYGRAILSMRHAGVLAGLGVMGRNTLLMNEDYGNMVQIGAVLVDAELEADGIADYEHCPPECGLCIDACPVGALDGETTNQKLCRPASIVKTEKGYILKKCYACRSICPNALGLKQ